MKWTEPEHTGIDWSIKGHHYSENRGLHPNNSMPRPFFPIDQETFMRLALCSSCQLTGEGNYRQVLEDLGEPKGRWEVTFFHHQSGYTLAVAKQYVEIRRDTEIDGAYIIHASDSYFGADRDQRHYAYIIRYFRVGCQHKNMKEVSHKFAQEELGMSTWGMFCHVYHCPDCGYHYSVDSSG